MRSSRISRRGRSKPGYSDPELDRSLRLAAVNLGEFSRRANTLRRRGEKTPPSGGSRSAPKKGVPFGLLNVLSGRRSCSGAVRDERFLGRLSGVQGETEQENDRPASSVRRIAWITDRAVPAIDVNGIKRLLGFRTRRDWRFSWCIAHRITATIQSDRTGSRRGTLEGRSEEWDVTDDPVSGDALGLDHDMWNGAVCPEVLQIDKTYEKEVTISDKEWAQLQTRLERSPTSSWVAISA